MFTRPFLVTTIEDFTDPAGVMEHPDGEPGGEGWTEFKDAMPVVLGTYHAENLAKAITIAANQYEVSPEVLQGHELRDQRLSPLAAAVSNEIHYLVNEDEYDVSWQQLEHTLNSRDEYARNIADNMEEFQQEVEHGLRLQIKEDASYPKEED